MEDRWGGLSGEDGAPDEDEEGSTGAENVERIDVGIPGLDDMIEGGVPRESMVLAMGGPGTGKTTFAMQYIHRALDEGGKGVYFTLDQSEASVVRSADSKGFDFSGYRESGDLEVVRMDPVEMMSNMRSIRGDLVEMIRDFGADRVAVDSVSHIEMMYEDPVSRRDQIFYFSESLKETGTTTLVTSEAARDNPYASRYGVVEYTSDAVFVLRQVRTEELSEIHLAIETMKVRDTDHSREIKPFEFTGSGIQVYNRASLF